MQKREARLGERVKSMERRVCMVWRWRNDAMQGLVTAGKGESAYGGIHGKSYGEGKTGLGLRNTVDVDGGLDSWAVEIRAKRRHRRRTEYAFA